MGTQNIYGTHPQTLPCQELIHSTGGDIGEPIETLISTLYQRSERKDRAHLFPPGCQGDLQVRTHPEAIPDEGKDHDAGGEEKKGDLRGPLCIL